MQRAHFACVLTSQVQTAHLASVLTSQVQTAHFACVLTSQVQTAYLACVLTSQEQRAHLASILTSQVQTAHLACVLTSQATGSRWLHHVDPVGLDALRWSPRSLLHPNLLHQGHRLNSASLLLRLSDSALILGGDFLGLHGHSSVWRMKLCGWSCSGGGAVLVGDVIGVQTKLLAGVSAP